MAAEIHRLADSDSLELAALRTALEEFDFADRMLIALHYGGGLTSEELAGELGVPLWSISLDLRSIRLVLYDWMRAQGFAETAVNAARIEEALTTGLQVPPELMKNFQR